jgi:nucleoside-diphosphate-sugar epimerase
MNSEISCFVTGSTGWVGRYLIRELLAEHNVSQVIIALRAKDNRTIQERFSSLKKFIGTSPKLKVFNIHTTDIRLPANITHIFHCASLVKNTNLFGDPVCGNIFDSNVSLTWRLIESATKLSNFSKFIHISTLMIRGNSIHKFTEGHLYDGQTFLTPYALTKYLSEQILLNYHQSIPLVIVRLGSVLGPKHGAGILPPQDWFYQTIRLWYNKRLDILPLGGDQHIYPIPVDILARCLSKLVFLRDIPQVLHIPYNTGFTVKEIFKVLSTELRLPMPLLYKQNSSKWQTYYQNLSTSMKRIVDSIYPQPIKSTLSQVKSNISKSWFESMKMPIEQIEHSYWENLVNQIIRNIKDNTNFNSREVFYG